MFAAPHGGHRCDGVNVIRGRHDHGVDAGLLVEHFPVVPVSLRPGVGSEHRLCPPEIHVAEGRDVLVGAAVDVAAGSTAGADRSDVESIARRLEADAAQDVPRHDGDRRCGGSQAADEVAPGDALFRALTHVALLSCETVGSVALGRRGA